ncbi:hypothetical protein QOZ80_3BG0280560 [Eleusine coracana subsp. coracana]|nr:hypothetical protein QOZ80_3BG0280560 [Eleusine coracana subsp. coracana]
MVAPLPCRAASPEFTPMSPFWMEDRSPDHSPSTTLRLGTKTLSPPHRAASPDYASSSTWRDAVYTEHTSASPEYMPLSHYGNAADYMPSITPAIRESSPFYAPDSLEYTPVSVYWRAPPGSADYTPSSPPCRHRAPSPDYSPSAPPLPVSNAESRTSPSRRHSY